MQGSAWHKFHPAGRHASDRYGIAGDACGAGSFLRGQVEAFRKIVQHNLIVITKHLLFQFI
jgi:hypothetical protein